LGQEQEAIELVSQAIQSGIFNDLGSGSNVDVCGTHNQISDFFSPLLNILFLLLLLSKFSPPVIRMDNTVQMLRNYVTPNPRLYQRQKGYVFPRGSTEVISETKQVCCFST
jgi:20S proteasome subunit beta 2